MRFLDYFLTAIVVLLAAYGICRGLHLVGQAYLTARLVRNARGHQAWMQWRFR